MTLRKLQRQIRQLQAQGLAPAVIVDRLKIDFVEYRDALALQAMTPVVKQTIEELRAEGFSEKVIRANFKDYLG